MNRMNIGSWLTKNSVEPKFFMIAAVGMLIVGSLMSAKYAHLFGKKEEVLISTLTKGLQRKHYQPEKMDDAFSQRVYTLFLKDLDGDKRFFTKKDIARLDKYRKEIDNEIEAQTFEFYHLALTIQAERVKQSEGWVSELLEKPFDLEENESIETDRDKREYAADDAALKDLWRKILKLEVVSRVEDMYAEVERAKEKKAEAQKEKDAKIDKSVDHDAADDAKMKDAATSADTKVAAPRTLVEMEAEARKKIAKKYTEWFKRFREQANKPDEQFSLYLNAITSAYDPHTSYFVPKAKEDFDNDMAGKLEGIGATLQTKDSYVKVTSIVPGSPAWKQGQLKADDVILKVAQSDKEAVDVMDMPLNDVVKMIRGKKGTEVRLTVKKADGSTVIVPIVRDVVELEDSFAKSAIIERESAPKLGYIYLPRFYADFENALGRHCARDMRKEVEKLKDEKVEGIIIDLRSNGGGSLNDVVDIGGLFIKEGPIVQVKSRGAEPEMLPDPDPSVLYSGPLVILVDQYSASASEILAAAMQDYGRAVIIGSKSTFGKGTVQRFFDLDRDAPMELADIRPLGSIKMTTQKFYRINGGTTQLKGVIPDIILPDNFTYIEKVGEKEEDYPLGWDEIKAAPHENWKGLTEKLPMLKKHSTERVSKDKHFSLINDAAKRLKEQRDHSSYSLKLEKYRAYQKQQEEASKPLRDLNKDINKSLKLSAPTSERAALEGDAGRKTRLDEWHKNIQKDVYIGEAINVITDLIK